MLRASQFQRTDGGWSSVASHTVVVLLSLLLLLFLFVVNVHSWAAVTTAQTPTSHFHPLTETPCAHRQSFPSRTPSSQLPLIHSLCTRGFGAEKGPCLTCTIVTIESLLLNHIKVSALFFRLGRDPTCQGNHPPRPGHPPETWAGLYNLPATEL